MLEKDKLEKDKVDVDFSFQGSYYFPTLIPNEYSETDLKSI